ncbi:MAG: hypothetical protein HOP02_00995 [Methylococcaceae bacterium]|nr:hypothetical protein [Methylococcaceae bacterium]
MNKKLLARWITLSILISTGCTNPPKRTALHDFGLAIPASTQQHQTLNKPTLTIDAPTWLWDNRIRYRLLYSAPTQVRFYGLDLWIASPPELFEQHLLNADSVIKYPLLIRLLDFEQQFDSPKQARVILRFSVDAYSIDHQHKLDTRLFKLELPTKTPDAEGAIAGFSALIQQATIKTQHWIAGLN